MMNPLTRRRSSRTDFVDGIRNWLIRFGQWCRDRGEVKRMFEAVIIGSRVASGVVSCDEKLGDIDLDEQHDSLGEILSSPTDSS